MTLFLPRDHYIFNNVSNTTHKTTSAPRRHANRMLKKVVAKVHRPWEISQCWWFTLRIPLWFKLPLKSLSWLSMGNYLYTYLENSKNPNHCYGGTHTHYNQLKTHWW